MWQIHLFLHVCATLQNEHATFTACPCHQIYDLATFVPKKKGNLFRHVPPYCQVWLVHFEVWQGRKFKRTLPTSKMSLPHPFMTLPHKYMSLPPQKMTLPHFGWQGHFFVWQGHFKVWQGHFKVWNRHSLKHDLATL